MEVELDERDALLLEVCAARVAQREAELALARERRDLLLTRLAAKYPDYRLVEARVAERKLVFKPAL